MADVILKVILEGAQQAEKDLGGIEDAFKGVGDEAKKFNINTTKAFSDSFDEAVKLNEELKKGIPKIDFTKPAKSIQELKAQIKGFTTEAIKAGEGTKAFSAAMAEAGKRKGDLKNLQQAIAALDPDTKGKAFLNLSQTIVSGFAAGTGALAAFGVTTEDAQKTLVKLQAALAFGQFLGQVGELGDTFKILKTQIQNSAAAQRVLNLVQSASPIGLALTGIAALTGAFLLSSDATEENTAATEINTEAIDKAREAREGLLKSINDITVSILKESGLIGDADADRFKAYEDFQNKQDENTKRLAKEQKRIDDELKNRKDKDDKDKELTQEQFFSKNTALLEEESRLRTEAANFERDLATELNTKLEDINKRAFNKKKETDKKTAEDNAKIIKKRNEDNAKIVKDGLDFIKKVTEKDNEDGIKTQEELNKKRDELEKSGTEKTIANIEVLTQAQKDANEIALQNEIKQNQAITDLARKERDVKIQMAQAAVDSLRAIASVAALTGSQSAEFQKALAIAQIAINTAQSISAGIAGATTSATATGPGAFVATPIFIATTIATILGAFASVASVINSATVPKPGFASGGYTGDGGKWDEAGVVHKGEFVTTKEDTAKHRGLLEAIHNDAAPSIADITALLKGTGVVLMPEVAGRISNELTASGNQKLYQQLASDKNLEELNKNFKKWMSQQGKNVDKTLPDGTRIIKVGNTIRTIRKRRI